MLTPPHVNATCSDSRGDGGVDGVGVDTVVVGIGSMDDGGTEEDMGKYNNQLGTSEGEDEHDTRKRVLWTTGAQATAMRRTMIGLWRHGRCRAHHLLLQLQITGKTCWCTGWRTEGQECAVFVSRSVDHINGRDYSSRGR